MQTTNTDFSGLFVSSSSKVNYSALSDSIAQNQNILEKLEPVSKVQTHLFFSALHSYKMK